MPDKLQYLNIDEVLAGYSIVSKLYPHTPSVSIWRSWEYAAYRRYALPEPSLDLGCGDGIFFRLVWPEVKDVTGIDIDLSVAENAQKSGVYSDVRVASADNLPFGPESFQSVFANCSIEHMDNLRLVLRGITRILKQNGTFLLSVVTDKFMEWCTLPLLAEGISGPEQADRLKQKYLAYHHLVSAFPPEEWVKQLEAAHFEVIEHIPIVPELSGRFFLFLDNLWHLKMHGTEAGAMVSQYLMQLPDFPTAFHDMIKGLLLAEKDWHTGCGAVFFCRKKDHQ